jgi:flagellar biosynthesis protein
MAMDPKEKKEPAKKAVALRYVPALDRAPKVTAKGSGLLAQKIIELAQKYGIPIKEDPVLIQVLSQLDFDQEVPPSIYVVVAEILAFVYSVNNRWRRDEGQNE